MPRLLQNERERAVGMFEAGMTQTEIANHFNCSRMTIQRLLVRVNKDNNKITELRTFLQRESQNT
jgi:DNA-binding transcriptional regulator LsrR (DeoR family)